MRLEGFRVPNSEAFRLAVLPCHSPPADSNQVPGNTSIHELGQDICSANLKIALSKASAISLGGYL